MWLGKRKSTDFLLYRITRYHICDVGYFVPTKTLKFSSVHEASYGSYLKRNK